MLGSESEDEDGEGERESVGESCEGESCKGEDAAACVVSERETRGMKDVFVASSARRCMQRSGEAMVDDEDDDERAVLVNVK